MKYVSLDSRAVGFLSLSHVFLVLTRECTGLDVSMKTKQRDNISFVTDIPPNYKQQGYCRRVCGSLPRTKCDVKTTQPSFDNVW